eukprot:2409474-Pleurochrysis_carterae.AAC.3
MNTNPGGFLASRDYFATVAATQVRGAGGRICGTALSMSRMVVEPERPVPKTKSHEGLLHGGTWLARLMCRARGSVCAPVRVCSCPRVEGRSPSAAARSVQRARRHMETGDEGAGHDVRGLWRAMRWRSDPTHEYRTVLCKLSAKATPIQSAEKIRYPVSAAPIRS